MEQIYEQNMEQKKGNTVSRLITDHQCDDQKWWNHEICTTFWQFLLAYHKCQYWYRTIKNQNLSWYRKSGNKWRTFARKEVQWRPSFRSIQLTHATNLSRVVLEKVRTVGLHIGAQFHHQKVRDGILTAPCIPFGLKHADRARLWKPSGAVGGPRFIGILGTKRKQLSDKTPTKIPLGLQVDFID